MITSQHKIIPYSADEAKGDQMHMNTLDYLILTLLVVSALTGYYRGLMSVLGGFASTLIALLIAIVYRKELALYLEKKFGLISLLSETMADKIPQPAWADSPAKDILPSIKTLPFVQEQLANFAQMIVVAISFILLYIIISKGLRLIWKLLEAPFYKGILGRINRLAGMLLLVAKNLLLMAVLLGILYPFVKSGVGMGITGLMNTSLWIDQSWTAPYLLNIFAGLESLLGL